MENSCPSPRELSDFDRGRLSEASALSVSRHLNVCQACRDAVEQLDPERDVLTAILNAQPPEDEFESEDGLLQLKRTYKAQAFDTIVGSGTGSSTNDSEAEQCPQRIGRYRIIDLLGAGGMGRVYRAQHTDLGKYVALKVLPEMLTANKTVVARFRKEMAAVGRLNHPNIVAATDAGEADGVHYLAMELVDGIDVGRVLRERNRLQTPEACEIARQVAWGLHYAHQKNLVHRDVKPSNIMLTLVDHSHSSHPSGGSGSDQSAIVKILDMGLARLEETPSESRSSLTGDGQVMGTPEYMAPEQSLDCRTVDGRADVYALGATLYKMLSGRVPFPAQEYGSVMNLMMAKHRQTPPPISQIVDGLPKPLAMFVDKMVQSEPTERVPSMLEVADTLGPYSSSADIAAVLSANVQSRSPEPPLYEDRSTDPGRSLIYLVATATTLTGLIAGSWHLHNLSNSNSDTSGPAVTEMLQGQENDSQQHQTVVGDKNLASLIGWVESRGGVVTFGDPERAAGTIRDPSEVSGKEFRIVRVSFQESPRRDKLRDGELAELCRLALAASDQKTFFELMLFHWKLSSAGLQSLLSVPNISMLFLTDCGLTDEGVKAVSNIQSLDILAIDHNPLLTDESLEHLSRSNIRELNISNTGLTSAGLKRFRPDKSLMTLYAKDTNLDDDSAEAILYHQELQTLELQNTLIREAFINDIAELTELSWLDLSSTAITDDSLRTLAQLTSLQTLLLRDTNISDQGLRALETLQELSELNVASTALSQSAGDVLPKVKSLKRLVISADQSVLASKTFLASMPQCNVESEPAIQGTGAIQRQFLRWVIARGGTIKRWSGETIGKPSDVPFYEIPLGEVWLQSYPITVNELEYLEGLLNDSQWKEGRLAKWHLNASALPPESIGVLKTWPVSELTLYDTQIDFDHMKQLAALPTPGLFGFTNCSFSEEATRNLRSVARRALWFKQCDHLSDLIPVLSGTSLSELLIESKEWNAFDFSAIRALRNLKTLYLANGRWTPQQLEEISELSQLTTLDLSNSSLDDAGITAIKSIPQLDMLNLTGNRVSTQAMETLLEKVPHISVLNVADTSIDRGLIPALRKLKKLARLNVAKTELSELVAELESALPQCNVVSAE